jgi:hypothetical protein
MIKRFQLEESEPAKVAEAKIQKNRAVDPSNPGIPAAHAAQKTEQLCWLSNCWPVRRIN